MFSVAVGDALMNVGKVRSIICIYIKYCANYKDKYLFVRKTLNFNKINYYYNSNKFLTVCNKFVFNLVKPFSDKYGIEQGNSSNTENTKTNPSPFPIIFDGRN